VGLFDWKGDDDDEPTVTLIGYATPEFEDNLRAGLGRPLAWDAPDDEVREQVGTCNICGGPGDGTACDHRKDGRPWWSSHPDPTWNEE
jgi:hypothetical protein